MNAHSKTLTAAEQAAIDAFPEEKIKKVPRGKSGVNFGYRWVSRTDGPDASGSLRPLDENGNLMDVKQIRERYRGTGKAVYKAAKKKAENLAKVRAAVDKGLTTIREISEETGLGRSAIERHRNALGVVRKWPEPARYRVLRLIGDGEWVGAHELVERSGLALNTVSFHMKRLYEDGEAERREIYDNGLRRGYEWRRT